VTIRIVHYAASASPLVQAFVDVEVDGSLRFNGLNFLRDGSLRPAQLTQMLREGKRRYRDAVTILDPDLEKLLAAEILAAIQKHVALLPPELRMRPPLPPPAAGEHKPTPTAQGAVRIEAAAAPAPAAAALPPRPAQTPASSPRKPLPPPARLLARGGPLRKELAQKTSRP
jgi:hypothetical protein